MKMIMEELGIPTLVITGQDENEPSGHAWNCVKIDGYYYDVDVTSDVKSSDKVLNMYCAYNVSRQWISSVYPLDSVLTEYYELPKTAGMNHSFHYLNNSLVRSGGDIEEKVNAALDHAADYDGYAYLQFKSDRDYENFVNHDEEYVNNWFNLYDFYVDVHVGTITADAYRTVLFTVEWEE